MTIQNPIVWLKDVFSELVGEKASFDDSEWSGSASQWPSAEAYCSDCLIDMNESGAEKTKDKCHLPYRKPGSGKINRNALRAMASGGRGIPALKGVPAEQKKKAANWAISHWQAAFDRPAPPGLYRIAGKEPPAEGKAMSGLKLLTGKDGSLWMVAFYSNRWEDRDKEIIKEAAHEEFIAWMNKNDFHPQVTLAHLPKLPAQLWTRLYQKFGDDVPRMNAILHKVFAESPYGIARVERGAYLNGFSMFLAKVHTGREALARKLSEMEDTGMSHLFLSPEFELDEETGILAYDKYRTFEASALARSRAANLATRPIIITPNQESEGDNPMTKKLNKDDREWLAQLLPQEAIAKLEENTETLAKQLDGLLAFKELVDADPAQQDEAVKALVEAAEKKEAPPEDEDEDDEDEKEDDMPAEMMGKDKEQPEEVSAAVVKAVVDTLNIPELQSVLKTMADRLTAAEAKNKQLEAQIAELKQSDDQKLSEMIMPSMVRWFQPTKDEATEAKDQEKTKEGIQKKEIGPKGSAGSKSETDNPLRLGFWNQIDSALRES